MANSITTPPVWETLPWAPLPQDIPILYEDEEEGDMGEANYHVLADEVLHICLSAHFREHQPECQVFSNMNLYYLDGPAHPQTGSAPYISPDTMVVKPYHLLPEKTRSYKIGRDGPPPLASIEILSDRSAQQRDLNEKMVVCRMLRIAEYILVDEIGKFLPQGLLLKRLGPDGEYHDFRDPDGGITSNLGFRIVREPDGLRVIHTLSGYRYIRPMESEQVAKAQRMAEQARLIAEKARNAAEHAKQAAEEARNREAQARRQAEAELKATQERIQALEAELARLKSGDQNHS